MDEVHPPHHQLLELIPNWPNQETNSEEKQLELRLGPPGDHENWTSKNGSTTKNSTSHREKDKSSLLSLGYFTPSAPSKTLHQPDIWINENQTHKFSSLLDMNTQVLGGNNYHQSLPLLRERESLHEQQQHQACGRSGKVVDLQKNTELKKAFSIASANDTAVTNSYDQKRYMHPIFFLFPFLSIFIYCFTFWDRTEEDIHYIIPHCYICTCGPCPDIIKLSPFYVFHALIYFYQITFCIFIVSILSCESITFSFPFSNVLLVMLILSPGFIFIFSLLATS